MNSRPEYVVFSDESRHTAGRFRSIAAVSLPASPHRAVTNLSRELGDAMECSSKGELKWYNVGRSGRSNVARANAATDFLFSRLGSGLRLDVLIWDTEDARHDVDERDDIANHGRMFFHLHRNLMKQREARSRWHVRPDKLVTADWETIRRCLTSDGTWRDRVQEELHEELHWLIPAVSTWREVESDATPFIQLADLMAGMAAYARTEARVVRELLAESPGQGDLFPAPVSDRLPRGSRHRGRFRVISHFHRLCLAGKLGVSLRTRGYFRTFDSATPINFWHYEPQHPHDRAPTKDRGRTRPFRRASVV